MPSRPQKPRGLRLAVSHSPASGHSVSGSAVNDVRKPLAVAHRSMLLGAQVEVPAASCGARFGSALRAALDSAFGGLCGASAFALGTLSTSGLFSPTAGAETVPAELVSGAAPGSLAVLPKTRPSEASSIGIAMFSAGSVSLPAVAAWFTLPPSAQAETKARIEAAARVGKIDLICVQNVLSRRCFRVTVLVNCVCRRAAVRNGRSNARFCLARALL